MGACWSNRIKAESPFNTGVNSKNVSRDRNDLSSSSSKLSSASVPPTPRSEGEILQSSNIKSFSFSELKTVTRNFRPDSVLGEGGFGSVFKGWIDEHSLAPSKPGIGMVVAVKRLNKEGLQGHKEWLAEINYLGQLQHPNLVKLIGYCFEDEHRLLVYEFMPRGSMENHLFRRGTYFLPLSWSLRMKIALDAAKGLAFLHNAETQVIYRDFKTSNILLDSNYNAKLSDFGLARDGPTGDKSHVSTRVMGTYGYPAPEYLATGHLTAMSDVYSFGVVFLEMLSGRRVVDKNRPSGQHNLVEWAKPYLINKRRIFRVLDGRLDGQYPIAKAQKAASLALQCLSIEPKNRPNMDEVVTVLEQLQDSKNAARSPKTDHQLNHRSQSTGGTRTFRSTVEASKRTTSYPRANLAFQCFSTEPKFRPKADEVVTALEQLQDSKNTTRSPKEDCQLNHHSESTGGTCTFQSTMEVSKGTTGYPRADLALQGLSTEPEIRPKEDEVVPALEQLDSKNSARSPKTGQRLNLRSRFAGGTWTFRSTVEASKRSTYPRPNLARCLSMETQFSPNMDEVVTALEQLQDTKNAARSPKKDHQLNHRSQSTGGTWTFRSIVEASKRTTSYPRPTASPLYA